MEIIITHLHKKQRGETLLHDISLRINGGIFGLLGHNGSGKTTLLRILATRSLFTSGEIQVGPYNLAFSRQRQALRQQLGYAPQLLDLPHHLTGRQFLDYMALLKGMQARETRVFEMGTIIEELQLEQFMDKQIATYSGGTCRRFNLAQALLGDPTLLLLDDPFANISQELLPRLKFLLLNRARRCTIIIANNTLEHTELYNNHTAILEQGRVKVISSAIPM